MSINFRAVVTDSGNSKFTVGQELDLHYHFKEGEGGDVVPVSVPQGEGEGEGHSKDHSKYHSDDNGQLRFNFD